MVTCPNQRMAKLEQLGKLCDLYCQESDSSIPPHLCSLGPSHTQGHEWPHTFATKDALVSLLWAFPASWQVATLDLGGCLTCPSGKVRKVCWFNEHDSAWPSWHPSQEDKIHPGPNYATICHLLGSIQPLPNPQTRNAQVRWIGASQIHLKSERIWSTCRSNLIGLAQWSDAGGSYIHPFRRSCLVCQTASLPWIETEPPREWQPEKGWYQLQARSLISSINCDANLLDLATI